MIAHVGHNAPMKSKLQHPLPHQGNKRAFDYFLCPGSEEFDRKGRSGGGELNLKCQVSKDFCFANVEVFNSYKHVFR